MYKYTLPCSVTSTPWIFHSMASLLICKGTTQQRHICIATEVIVNSPIAERKREPLCIPVSLLVAQLSAKHVHSPSSTTNLQSGCPALFSLFILKPFPLGDGIVSSPRTLGASSHFFSTSDAHHPETLENFCYVKASFPFELFGFSHRLI